MANEPAKVLGRRITQFRKNLNLTQAELAKKLGVSSAQIISQIEKGEREVKAWELVRLSQILFISLTELLTPAEGETHPAVLWRVLPSKARTIKEAKFFKRCKEYALLEDLSGTTRRAELPYKKVEPASLDFNTGEVLADEIRREFGLGDRPAASLEKTLEEQYGVKIWYEELDEGSAATTIGNFGPAILMNRKESPWRRNYNFAHELFHLITWHSIPARRLQNDTALWERIEKTANFFASCLLLPGDAVRMEVEARVVDGEIADVDLIEIARRFDVSTEALLWRLLNLRLFEKETVYNILDNEDFRKRDRATMPIRWWDPPALPERFVRLAFVAYQKGRLSRARLAGLLESTLPDVSATLRRYGLDDSEVHKKIGVRAA